MAPQSPRPGAPRLAAAATAVTLPWAASRVRAIPVLLPGTTESIASAWADGLRGNRRGPSVRMDGATRRARLASRRIHAALSAASKLCNTVNPSSTNRHTASRHASSAIQRGSPATRSTACGKADCKRTACLLGLSDLAYLA